MTRLVQVSLDETMISLPNWRSTFDFTAFAGSGKAKPYSAWQHKTSTQISITQRQLSNLNATKITITQRLLTIVKNYRQHKFYGCTFSKSVSSRYVIDGVLVVVFIVISQTSPLFIVIIGNQINFIMY